MDISEIINEAASRLNEPVISDVFSTVNNQAKMYLSSAKKMSRDIAERTTWGELVIPYSFTTLAGVQEYCLPEDYKEVITDMLYNSTSQWAILKETPDQAQSYISTGNSSWTDTRYRIVRNKIRFTIPADSVDTIRYEYKSKYLAENGGNYAETFEDSEDTYVLDDEALIMGIVYDVTRKYQFNDMAILKDEYENKISDLITKEAGRYVIHPSGDFKTAPYPRNWNLYEE